jgi:hypothetical protein
MLPVGQVEPAGRLGYGVILAFWWWLLNVGQNQQNEQNDWGGWAELEPDVILVAFWWWFLQR